jgi:hypothetical protein
MKERIFIDFIKLSGHKILNKGRFKTDGYLLLYYYLLVEKRKLIHNRTFDEMRHWKTWLQKFSKIDSTKKLATLFVHANPFFYAEIFDKHEIIWPVFFEPFKMVFVHRDPCDQFADIVKNDMHITRFEHRFYTGTYHMDAAERYFNICKNIYLARLRMAKDYSPEQLLIVSFEDFLLNHQSVINKLKSFLGIKSERDQNNNNFVLEESIKNIGNGKKNIEAMSFLEKKPYIMDELYRLHNELDKLPQTIH